MRLNDVNPIPEFVRPTGLEEHDEVLTQLEAIASGEAEAPVWVTQVLKQLAQPENYSKALAQGKVRKIPDRAIQGMGNYSGELDSIDGSKLQRVKQMMSTGGKVTMPIVLRHGFEYWLLAGNTRLSYNTLQSKHSMPVLILEY